MKIRIFQLYVEPGRPHQNTQRMLDGIEQARRDGVQLIVFPEMAVPGYLLGDEWERLSFLQECEACGERLRAAAKDIIVIFGNVALDKDKLNEDGRIRKYNACFVAQNQHFLDHPRTKQPFFIKLLMPNYREFDDNRHFYDPRKLAYELKLNWTDLIEPAASSLGLLGCLICEDGWDTDYNISPSAILAQKKASIFINISSSPYTFFKNHKRYRVFSEHAARFSTPLIYANAVGVQDNGKTIFTFDGSSAIYSATGQLLNEAPAYTECCLDFDFSQAQLQPLQAGEKTDSIANQYAAIHYGTKTFLQRTGINKMVIGVSGGIDSAVVAAIYRQILPKDNILLVSMPGPYTSSTTKQLARQLAQNLDCAFAEIPIEDSVHLTTTQLSNSVFQSSSGSLTLALSPFVIENIQARDRSARVLAGVAAAFGGAFTCNANKSEMTVGYSTLYGDLGGCVASIADLWKGEVYELARWLNAHIYGFDAIPTGTLSIVPSAELSDQQNVDQGKGDPLFYPYHDTLFRSWVERWNRATPEDNLEWYKLGNLNVELNYTGDVDALFPTAAEFIADLERWWNLYQGMAVAKRIQAPPVIAVKRRAFGFDHREAQLGPRYSERYQQLKSELLARNT